MQWYRPPAKRQPLWKQGSFFLNELHYSLFFVKFIFFLLVFFTYALGIISRIPPPHQEFVSWIHMQKKEGKQPDYNRDGAQDTGVPSSSH